MFRISVRDNYEREGEKMTTKKVETFVQRKKRLIREIRNTQDVEPLHSILYSEAKKLEEEGLVRVKFILKT